MLAIIKSTGERITVIPEDLDPNIDTRFIQVSLSGEELKIYYRYELDFE
jgi:hypothetical protein